MAIELLPGPPTAAELARDAAITGRAGDSDSGEGAGVREETAAPTAAAMEGLSEGNNAQAPSTFGLFQQDGQGGVLYGRVVGVIRRNWRQYAGSIEASTAAAVGKSAGNGGEEVGAEDGEGGSSVPSSTQLFAPVNKRIPRILISTRRAEELSKSRLLVAIDHWPADSAYPQGHYVRVLGAAGSKDVEAQVLLHEFEVPHEAFSPEVMACLPPPGKLRFCEISLVMKPTRVC